MKGIDSLWLRVYRDVGADRYLSHAELPAEATPTTRSIWEVYDRLFGRFTGAGLDPLFARFAHPPDRRLARPLLPRGLPVLVTGTGPSLEQGCDDLRRIRDRVIVTSSVRGALALQARGLFADLVLVEHQTLFDVQASADERRHSDPARLHPDTAVLAQPSTPAALLADLTPGACRLAMNLPTWGLWPATLVALALELEAPAVGLLGIDLAPPGATEAGGPVDQAHRPLVALLELLAYASGACRDCGIGGAHKPGWSNASLLALADTATATRPPRPVMWRHEQTSALFKEEAVHDLRTVQPLLPDARAALDIALQARAGNLPEGRSLTRAIELMLAWGADTHVRRVCQRGLGLSFLPRFWRTGIRMGTASQLWRPLILALQELTTQADRLAALIDGGAAHAAGSQPSTDKTANPSGTADMEASEAASASASASDSACAPASASELPSASPSATPSHAGAESEPDDDEPSSSSSSASSPDASGQPAAQPTRHSPANGGRPRRVSVLLPVKNGLPHLHDAMASLIGQTHPDLEILVIDGGSEDGGPEEIQARALSHVRVIPSNGRGLAAALNTGLKLATGAYVARQDADDWSHPERLARQFDYLSRHPEIDLLATCAEFVDDEGRFVDTAWTATVRRQHDRAQTPAALARLLSRTCALQHGTVMARRDVLRRAGGYRPAFAGATEYDLSLRLLPDTPFAKLPTRLYTCRLHDRLTSQLLGGQPYQDQHRRALVRATLEFVLRQVPEIAARARVALAADARSAELYREIGRDLGLAFTDDLLPPSPLAAPLPPDESTTPAAAAWRDLATTPDALVIADVDQIDQWRLALAAADDAADWIDIGTCLVRRARK